MENVIVNLLSILIHINLRFRERAPEPIPPSFKGAIVPPKITTVETMDAYFEVPVDAGNGHKVDFMWLKNGEAVHFGM